MPDTQVVEVALDLIDVKDGVGSYHVDGLLLFLSIFVFFDNLKRFVEDDARAPFPRLDIIWSSQNLSA